MPKSCIGYGSEMCVLYIMTGFRQKAVQLVEDKQTSIIIGEFHNKSRKSQNLTQEQMFLLSNS